MERKGILQREKQKKRRTTNDSPTLNFYKYGLTAQSVFDIERNGLDNSTHSTYTAYQVGQLGPNQSLAGSRHCWNIL